CPDDRLGGRRRQVPSQGSSSPSSIPGLPSPEPHGVLGGVPHGMAGPAAEIVIRKRQPGITSTVLPAAFFDRPADKVARELLGKALIRRICGRDHTLIVTETEAYLGPHDLACHSARGCTARTETMFGPPGTLYIYLVYGLHCMLNIVTGPEGYAAAVLVRGAGRLTGPGRLARTLAISRELTAR